MEPAAQREKRGQAVQLDADVAATTAEYLAEGQSVQSVSPGLALKWPARHGEHDWPSAPEYPGRHVHAVARAWPAADLVNECTGQPVHGTSLLVLRL